MTEKEKNIKNDVLDVLDDYYNVISLFNKGMKLRSAKAPGGFDNDLKKIEELRKSFRDVTLSKGKKATK